MSEPEFVLSIACPDRRGIVAEVTKFLFERNCNILDSQQFGDRGNGRFFMRVHCLSEGAVSLSSLTSDFAAIQEKFLMEAQLFDSTKKTRAAIQQDTVLAMPLYSARQGAALDVTADCNIIFRPFVHLAMTRDNKVRQEAKLAQLMDEHKIDLMVLARYMQILSDDFCRSRIGRIINIHHSFLPSFKGANPYTQAHERGVKLIGATAHYVTGDLDEGPIIDQAVERVTHAQGPEDYIAVGRDIESRTLARAVKWHCEHRILLNGRMPGRPKGFAMVQMERF